MAEEKELYYFTCVVCETDFVATNWRRVCCGKWCTQYWSNSLEFKGRNWKAREDAHYQSVYGVEKKNEAYYMEETLYPE